MIERFIFEELPAFHHHAVLTNNAISNAFDSDQATKICRAFREWLHLEDQPGSISIAFRGLSLSPKNPNMVAAFSTPESKTFGGISVATFFANHIVNLATKSEAGTPSDFDRGFLGILFADIADDLFTSIFPGTQLFLDDLTLRESGRTQENYVFVFDLRINERSDYIFLHLPENWKIPQTRTIDLPESDLILRFPVIVGFIPVTFDTLKSCSPGDLLIPDHAIHKDDISPTYPYAQIKLSENAQINVALSFRDGENWICTFLEKDLSMNDSLSTLLVENAQLNIRILAGSVEIPLKELSSIKPGFTLELDRAIHEGVDLEVNGQIFAKGELVNVGGKLGVRIVSRV